jgi:hypothetical protein
MKKPNENIAIGDATENGDATEDAKVKFDTNAPFNPTK